MNNIIIDFCKIIYSQEVLIMNLLSAILTFMLTFLLVRVMLPAEYGVYVICFSFFNVIQSFFGVKIGEILLRIINEDKDISNAIGKCYVIEFVVGLLMFFIAVIAAWFYADYVDYNIQFLIYTSFCFLVNVTSSTTENILIITGKVRLFYRIKLFSNLVHLITAYSLGYMYGVHGVIGSLILQLTLKTIFQFSYVYYNQYEVKEKNCSYGEMINFFKKSFLSSTFKSGTQGLDVMILSLVVAAKDIAIYDVAKKFAQIPSLILGSIWASSARDVALNCKKGNAKLLNIVIFDVYKVWGGIGAILIILLFFFIENIVAVGFGEQYMDSAFFGFVLFCAYWLGNLFSGFGRTYFIAKGWISKLIYLNAIIFFGVTITIFYENLSTKDMVFINAIVTVLPAVILNYLLYKEYCNEKNNI